MSLSVILRERSDRRISLSVNSATEESRGVRSTMRFFAALRMIGGEGLAMTHTPLPIISHLFQPTFHNSPVYVLEKDLDVVSSLQPVIGDEGMLEDIHYQNRDTTSRMANIMFIYPLVKELPAYIILV